MARTTAEWAALQRLWDWVLSEGMGPKGPRDVALAVGSVVQTRMDVEVRGTGMTLLSFRGKSRAGRTWIRNHVDGVRDKAGWIVAEPGYAVDVFDGMREAGLVLCRTGSE